MVKTVGTNLIKSEYALLLAVKSILYIPKEDRVCKLIVFCNTSAILSILPWLRNLVKMATENPNRSACPGPTHEVRVVMQQCVSARLQLNAKDGLEKDEPIYTNVGGSILPAACYTYGTAGISTE